MDLISITAIICAIAAIHIGYMEYTGKSLILIYAESYSTIINYVILLSGLYFGLYATTQLPKVNKIYAL